MLTLWNESFVEQPQRVQPGLLVFGVSIETFESKDEKPKPEQTRLAEPQKKSEQCERQA